jgi:hypothetical protein
LSRLGFFSTESDCSKLIDFYLIDADRATVELTLEQICREMIDTVGVERSTRVLLSNSAKFEKGTFSSRSGFNAKKAIGCVDLN